MRLTLASMLNDVPPRWDAGAGFRLHVQNPAAASRRPIRLRRGWGSRKRYGTAPCAPWASTMRRDLQRFGLPGAEYRACLESLALPASFTPMQAARLCGDGERRFRSIRISSARLRTIRAAIFRSETEMLARSAISCHLRQYAEIRRAENTTWKRSRFRKISKQRRTDA